MMDFTYLVNLLGLISSVVTVVGFLKNINYMKFFVFVVISIFSKQIILTIGLFHARFYSLVLSLEILVLVLNFSMYMLDGNKLGDIFENDDNDSNKNYIIVSILPLIFILMHIIGRLFVKPDLLVGDISTYLQKLSNMKINLISYQYMLANIKITLYLIEQTVQLICLGVGIIIASGLNSKLNNYDEPIREKLCYKLYKKKEFILLYGILFELTIVVRLGN